MEAHRVNQAGDKAHFRCLIAFCGFIEIYACCLAWWQYSGKMWYITQNLYYPKTRNGVQDKSASLFTSKLSVLESDHRRGISTLLTTDSDPPRRKDQDYLVIIILRDLSRGLQVLWKLL